jgi:hypothetical protein
MTARLSGWEFETDEEFFRYYSGYHGRNRSLSSLWQRFNATPLPSLAGMTGNLPTEP